MWGFCTLSNNVHVILWVSHLGGAYERGLSSLSPEFCEELLVQGTSRLVGLRAPPIEQFQCYMQPF
jgi:hypothetical protein